ncbi:MAG: hypothetical protein EOO17_02450 [Chloroflexi bacterium]|nr:MAG: hypothetical protein EOO17_02450 [Chloroflexota bacterium]
MNSTSAEYEGVDISRMVTIGDRDHYQLQSRYGSLDAIHSPDGVYQIANFDVSRPRHGHGRELLLASHDHARELGAKAMFAIIISREAYESARKVFGDEALVIESLGGYKSDRAQNLGHTSALLFGHMPIISR